MRRWWVWILGGVAFLVVAAVAASFFIDEPLRRYVERQMNARLQGYTVRIGALDVHPLSFSVDVTDVSLTQDAHPDPPVVRIPALSAGVQWRALLSGTIVADVGVERPALYLNFTQLVHEARDEVPVQERGWQEAVQAVSPLQINELQVMDGEITYVDADTRRPMRLGQLNVRAGNIRNVTSEAGVYPSDLRVDAVLDGVGRITLNGQADFLAVPHAAVKAECTLEQVELAQFQAVASRHHVALQGGVLSAVGTIEYAPGVKVVHLRQAILERLQADYVHMPQTVVVEQRRVRRVKQAAKGPDFALAASIEDTRMPALNPLLRAYGKVDVVGGFFSVFTEMRVQNRAVRGYVKPLIRELDVYDARQDREKNLFQKLYEAAAGGVSQLLENFPRDEVATQADLSGPLEDPQASTWQVVVTLIQNAFFRAILPGFERELGRSGRGAP